MPMRSMPSRDYYTVLNVQPGATAAEIKLAYRKLAMQYHPDRTGGNVHTEVLFKEINEAYGVLSNEQKRDDYNRMRDAHRTNRVNTATRSASSSSYSTSQNTQRQRAPLSGKNILSQCMNLHSVIDRTNPFAINIDSLYAKIEGILSDSHIHTLLYENKRIVTSQVIHELLACCKPLPENYFNAITPRLFKLSGTDAIMRNAIQQAVKQKHQDSFWQKYKFWWVLLVTLIICLLIYIM